MTQRIHIAALIPYQVYPPKMGGQKSLARFYQYLSGLLPVTIISTRKNEFPAELSAKLLPVLSNSRFRYINFFLFFRFKSIFRKNDFSHLIIEHPYFGWLGVLLKKFCHVKLVVHSHNIESLRFKSIGKYWWRILWEYEKFTHRHADINFFISDEDREFAIKRFRLSSTKCHTITYGFDMKDAPADTQIKEAKKILTGNHHIAVSDKILFFNGTLDYKPNLDALDIILTQINTKLLKLKSFTYKILICGKNLPAKYNGLKDYRSQNIIYAGFVDDINIYFRGADIFINPVTDGGGIKTKLVEALGNNLSSVSTKNGAMGVNKIICGNKLYIVEDGNWVGFTDAIIKADMAAHIPPEFFDHFYWGYIAARASCILQLND